MAAIFWYTFCVKIDKRGVKLFAFKRSLVIFSPTDYLVCILVSLDSKDIIIVRLATHTF